LNIGKFRYLCVLLALCVACSCLPVGAVSPGATYLAKIVELTAVYDQYTGFVEFELETEGGLYSDQQFTATISCSAYENGAWVTDKIITEAIFNFTDSCVNGHHAVGAIALSKALYTAPDYKDFALAVEGQSVDMGGMFEDYYNLDSKTVSITLKPEPSGSFFTLAAEGVADVPAGDIFEYNISPKNITKNLSGGLRSFSFTLNYDPQYIELSSLDYMYPRGMGWRFKECKYVEDGIRISLEGDVGLTKDKEGIVAFAFRVIKQGNPNFYALDVGGADAYDHSFTDAEGYYINMTPPEEDKPPVELPPVKVPLLGDVDGDDLVDSTDASLVLKYDAGLIPEVSIVGDVNYDDLIDSTDASLILKYDAGLIDRLGLI